MRGMCGNTLEGPMRAVPPDWQALWPNFLAGPAAHGASSNDPPH